MNRAEHSIVGLAVAVLVVASIALPAAGIAAETAEQSAGAGSPPPGKPTPVVQMAEVTLETETVHGRIVHETDELIKIERLGGGVIGYRKAKIAGLRRYSAPLAAYQERQGDFYQQRAWQVDDAPAYFRRAERAYRKALAQGPAQEEGARLRQKLDALARAREEWRKDELSRAEIQKAREEAELARVEKELVQRQLAATRRNEEAIEQLRAALVQIEAQNRKFVDAINSIGRDMEELAEEIDRVRRQDRIYITNTIFLGLKASHDSLRREVDGLKRRIEGANE